MQCLVLIHLFFFFRSPDVALLNLYNVMSAMGVCLKHLRLVEKLATVANTACHCDREVFELFLCVVHLVNTIPQNLKKSTLFLKKVSVLVHSAL